MSENESTSTLDRTARNFESIVAEYPDVSQSIEMKFRDKYSQPETYSLAQLQSELSQIQNTILERYSELNEHDVGLLIDLIAGPLRVPSEAFHGTQEEESKETMARVSGLYVNSVLFGASEDSDPRFTHLTYNAISRLHSLANTREGKDRRYHLFESGVAAQTELERILIENNFHVFQPDFTQDPYEVEPEDNEILVLDVQNGTDVIAKKNGHISLIDCKSRYAMKNPSARYGRTVERFIPDIHLADTYLDENVDNLESMPPLLQQYIQSERNNADVNSVKRYTVFIPSGYMDLRVKPAKNTESERLALAHFGRLEDLQRNELARKLTIIGL